MMSLREHIEQAIGHYRANASAPLPLHLDGLLDQLETLEKQNADAKTLIFSLELNVSKNGRDDDYSNGYDDGLRHAIRELNRIFQPTTSQKEQK